MSQSRFLSKIGIFAATILPTVDAWTWCEAVALDEESFLFLGGCAYEILTNDNNPGAQFSLLLLALPIALGAYFVSRRFTY